MGISDVDERGMDGAVDAAMLGRAPELDRIREFLDRLTRGPAALVIHGDMGIGKSALLRAALVIAAVAGIRVLFADPETPELALPFAGLIDLVDPVLDAAAELLPEPQLRALQIAVLRQAPGPTPVESLAVAVGLLGLVRSLAHRTPVLIAIDDAQWLDAPSAAALRFMTRRLRDEPVGFIVTQRADATAQPPPFLPSPSALDLTSIPLGPLSDDTVTAILRSLPGPELSARQVRQVVRAAAGNPYFAIELRRTAARDSIRRGEPLVEVPGTLLAALEQRLATFDDDVLAALLVVAALANPRVSLVRRALGPRDPTLLDPALADGVLVRSGERLRFAHPLLRSVAYQRAPESERLALHRRLAVVVADPVERAWHLVAGHQQPDSRTAKRIASGAGIALGRGAPGEAAELYLAAAARLPVRVHRGRVSWTEAAAACFAEAGDHGRAERLLEGLIVSTRPGPIRADQMRRLAALRYRREDPPAAIEILERARLEAVADPAVASAIEQQLALNLTMLGRLGAAADHAQRALELARASGNAGAEAGALAFVVIIGFIRGRGLDASLLDRAIELEAPGMPRLIEWRPSMIRALILGWTGQLADARAMLEGLHVAAQANGDEDAIPYLLYARCQVELAIGRWDVAMALADAARPYLAEIEGLMNVLLRSAVARIDASVGRIADAVALSEEGLATATIRRYGPGIQENAGVLGFAALMSGQPERTVALLLPVVPFLEAAEVRDPGILPLVPDLVEALIALGRLEDAESILAPYETAALRLARLPALPLAARCRALLALARGDAGEALQRANEALALHGAVDTPFERARTLLALGLVQRRRREKRAAATSLGEALATFERLGAPLWASRARDEHARIGLRPAAPSELSPTEERVAQLAARGLTARQIAAAAFLSPKGVEKAIARVYRKLGVGSRAELGSWMSERSRAHAAELAPDP